MTFSLYICLCILCMPVTSEGQKRGTDPLELKLKLL